ncbi:acid phosphatase-domain-containing protein [Favolaschia claudopus]|uniref:Acid phosphatase-domain-containing protein n=1 Tax=Favolaschia claudopus TaxID=2862362 RepID=A0AAW0DEV6_9AGAR
MYPRLVALDLDGTVWRGWLDANRFSHEDNLYRTGNTIVDRRNSHNTIMLFPHVLPVIQDLLAHGVQVAVVSRNTSRALCDRALWHFGIIGSVSYDEVYDVSKINHFARIQAYTAQSGEQIDFSDMLLFDDDPKNREVEITFGVTFKTLQNDNGLTWDSYQAGLAVWRRNKLCMRGIPLSLTEQGKKRFVGWVGTSGPNAARYRQGLRRLDYSRPARYGYGLYMTDDPAVAMFFASWDRPVHDRYICAIYVRDGELFDQIHKVSILSSSFFLKQKISNFDTWPQLWIPENNLLKTDNEHGTQDEIARSQEARDQYFAGRFNIQKPYILFSRHHHMPEMGPGVRPGRFNEMVVYPQLQDSLFYAECAVPAAEFQAQYMPHLRGRVVPFEGMVNQWRIRVVPETIQECKNYGEML